MCGNIKINRLKATATLDSHTSFRRRRVKMFVVRRSSRLYPAGLQLAKMSNSQLGDLGSGAGKGGGGGGSIREAGGAFGKLEAAREEEYFYKKQKDQLERLKNDQIHQAEFHHQQIKEHEEAIQRHQQFLDNLNK